MSNPKPKDMDSTIEALQAQIERVKWNVEYHQEKLKEEAFATQSSRSRRASPQNLWS